MVSDANGVCADAAVNGDAEVDCSSEDYDARAQDTTDDDAVHAGLSGPTLNYIMP